MAVIHEGEQATIEELDEESDQINLLEIDRDTIESSVLARLIDEVRNEPIAGHGYNRSYHRHNR